MTSTHPERTVILVATDGNSTSDDALRAAAVAAAKAQHAEIHIVYVLEPIPDSSGRNALLLSFTDVVGDARSLLNRAAELVKTSFSGRVATHLSVGSPWREILQLATSLGADLVIVGSHGRTGVGRFFIGSVSEQVVRRARCPVLVARPKDYGIDAVPDIEPACPDCVAVQAETSGERLWCSRHERRQEHPHGHVHYELPQSFGVGSMLFRPETSR